MNVLIVLAHPEQRSFNGAMYATAEQRAAWLAAWTERLQGVAAESPVDVGRY